MSYLVLARKWRPVNFDQVIGQESVIRTLKNAISMNRVAHAYLFTGARGVGKTTVARILAKALNCQKGTTADPDDSCVSCQEIARGISPDVFEIDGASNTGVDDVRSLRDNSMYLPAKNRFKIYIIDEVHMLSTSAFNALLKTLEEPPAHVKFIFATTEPHKIPMTVLSRCQRFDFKRIPSTVIFDQLKTILSSEGAKIEEEGIRLIAREAAGSMRDALSLCDQILAFGGDHISTEQVLQALGITTSSMFQEVVQALVDNKPDELMHLVDRLFDEGHDLKRFMEGLLWYVRHLIFCRTLDHPETLLDLLEEERKQLRLLSQRADALRWHQVFDVLSRALEELSRNPHPRLVVETALLRLASIEPLLDVSELLQRIEKLSAELAGKPDGIPIQESKVATFVPPSTRPAPKLQATNKATPKATPVSASVAPSASNPAETAEVKSQQALADGHGTKEPACSGKFPEGWEKLVALVSKQRPSLGSVLNHACPLELSPQRVRIALEPGSFFADQMRVQRNRQDMERICTEFYGNKPQILVEERSGETGPTLAQARENENADSQNQLREQALAHPMVQEAIRIFGAEVTQIQPVGRRES